MKKKKVIKSIRNNCNVCLKPSKVCDGVGVFALIDIPKGTILFEDTKPDTDFISWEEIGDIPIEVKNYLSNICLYVPNRTYHPIRDLYTQDGIYLSRSVSSINLSYYVNHSEDYNVIHDLNRDEYVTSKDIKKGEEILCLYTKNEIDW